MSKNMKTPTVKLIPIDKINILNPRVRNQKVFKDIVANIAQVGLKRPPTVTKCHSGVPDKDYDLICGQGRIEAFITRGQTKIPALVIDVDEETALIMSLVENMARRHHSSLELLKGIDLLKEKGYDARAIAKKIGVHEGYVADILTLRAHGEERLVNAVENGHMPLALAITIAKFPDDEQRALHDAYQSGELKGKRFLTAKRQLDLRRRHGKLLRNGREKKSKSALISKADIMKNYQKEIDRKRLMKQKADTVTNMMSFIVTGLRQLLKEDHFLTLLRAEKIEDMPTRVYELVKASAS
jgi:ParB family chromosome partitioning protein